MRKVTIPVILLCILINTSCSRMIVNVSTADLKVVTEKTDSMMDRVNAYKYSTVKGNFFSNSLFNETELNKIFIDVINNGITEGFTNEEDAIIFINNFKASISQELSSIKSIYNEGVILTSQEKYNLAIDKFLDAALEANTLGKLISKEYGEKAKDLFDQIDLLEKTIIDAPLKNKNNLLGDPLVSFITKDENKYIWKSQYNKTKSWTALGNSDIAIVLKEDPESYNNNYTIKGVRVDADKLIQSSFDVLAQSINILASTQGVSVPDDTDNNYFAPTVIPAIQNLESEKNKLEGKEEMLKAYKKFIILEILNKDLDNKTIEELKTSVEEIKNVWASYKINLEKL